LGAPARGPAVGRGGEAGARLRPPPALLELLAPTIGAVYDNYASSLWGPAAHGARRHRVVAPYVPNAALLAAAGAAEPSFVGRARAVAFVGSLRERKAGRRRLAAALRGVRGR
jgi:hypothetical protein